MNIISNFIKIKYFLSYADLLALALHSPDHYIAHLMQDTATQDQHLPCYPLLVRRNEERFLMPDEKFVLQCGDRILFCGKQIAFSRMQLLVQNYYVLNEMLTGQYILRSILWRWISNHRNVTRQAMA